MQPSFCKFAARLSAAIVVALLASTVPAAGQSPVLYGASPGAAEAEIQGTVLSLSNEMMQAQWSVSEGKLTGLKLVDRSTGAQISLSHDPFILTFKDGTSVRASQMTIADGPRIDMLRASPGAARAAEHFAGKAIRLRLEDPKSKLAIVWRATLRDDSNYVREEVALSAPDSDQPIADASLFNSSLPGAKLIGTVKGSPVAAGDFFLGFEDPLAQCRAAEILTCDMKRELPLRKGQTVTYSLVLGVSPPGQMRRAFLNYV
jgi:hypothetical protein